VGNEVDGIKVDTGGRGKSEQNLTQKVKKVKQITEQSGIVSRIKQLLISTVSAFYSSFHKQLKRELQGKTKRNTLFSTKPLAE
jgi:hypothetical protein